MRWLKWQFIFKLVLYNKKKEWNPHFEGEVEKCLTKKSNFYVHSLRWIESSKVSENERNKKSWSRERMKKFFRVIVFKKLYNLLMLLSLDLVFKFDIHSLLLCIVLCFSFIRVFTLFSWFFVRKKKFYFLWLFSTMMDIFIFHTKILY